LQTHHIIKPGRSDEPCNLLRVCERCHRICLPWSPDHLKVIAKIEAAVRHGGLFALAMPRGSGKTTLVIRAMLWALLYGFRRFGSLKAAEEALALCKPRQAKGTAELAASDFLPLPSEHFIEVRSTPENWLHYAFTGVSVADGIRRLDAKPRSGGDDTPLEPAAYCFDDSKWTFAEAQEWMRRRGYIFARATPSKNSTYAQITARGGRRARNHSRRCAGIL